MTTKQASNRWYMAGTEGTGEFRVLAFAKYGRLGVRPLANNTVRIRVEPVNQEAADIIAVHFPASNGWKQYGEDGQLRFSKVYRKDDELGKTIQRSIKALGPLTSRRYNWRFLGLALGRF